MKLKISRFLTLTLTVIFLLSFASSLLIIFGCTYRGEKDNVVIWATYNAGEGGTVNGRNIIAYPVDGNGDAEIVKAVADEGYYFLKWSDGLENAERQDLNLDDDLNVTALFSPITNGVAVRYFVDGDGYISGKSEQVVQYGTAAWEVTAQATKQAIDGVLEERSVFIGWSDGLTCATRNDTNVTEELNVTALFGYPVEYTAADHGSIEGVSSQVLMYGEYTETVVAVPDEGFTFVGWSDGVKSAERTDRVIDKLEVTAVFEWRDTDYFYYHYNYASANNTEQMLTLTRGEVDGCNAIVPVRDYYTFEGWYYDEQFAERATDSFGVLLDGESIFAQPSRDLYAKWKLRQEYVVTYRILMVYVTEVDAQLETVEGDIESVHYKMSKQEREWCEEITVQFGKIMNELLDGLVNFQIDSYFTKDVVTEEEIIGKNDSDREYYISAQYLSEIIDGGIDAEYRGVITTYSFGGNERLNPVWAGTGSVKYAVVPFDKFFDRSDSDGEVGFRYYGGWEAVMPTYVHEFIHTIEEYITCYSLHTVLATNSTCFDNEVEVYKLYLMNLCPVRLYDALEDGKDMWQAWTDSEKVGIPYSYWTDELYTVSLGVDCVNNEGSYAQTEGGWIRNVTAEDYLEWQSLFDSKNQIVPSGSRTTEFEAVPMEGYTFVGWSDGCKDMRRIITNVTSDINITALFERNEYTVRFETTEGGFIEGNTLQNVLISGVTEYVEAVPMEGYEFIGWSDGHYFFCGSVKYCVLFSSSKLQYIDENGVYTVTAIFRKI